MRVVQSDFAKRQILNTARYIRREFGKKSKESFLQKVRETRRLLADNPYLGPIEPLLADLPQTYRSVVVAKVNKIVYRIVDDRIEIADLWDCRREPNKQREQTIARDEFAES
ncbi:MAG: type II toxin-antitoxin system RelE/ParE family toxin [Bacteroidales bacterium]|nr:type II toxin-antitoxin system RelE/ParE family toxin [Bacteroidales bacterium]